MAGIGPAAKWCEVHRELAATLGYQFGSSPSLIQKWEEGLAWPKIPDLLPLTRYLRKPIDYFLHGVDGPTFEETAVELGIITDSELLQVRSATHRQWSGDVPFDYPDPERDGITEEVRDYRRNLFGEIHLQNPPKGPRPPEEGD